MLLGSKVHRTPGDRWMIHGPTDYIPRTEIGNIQRRLGFMYLQNHVYQFNVNLIFCGVRALE